MKVEKGKGGSVSSWGEGPFRKKEDCTISTEALREGRGVGDVIGRVLLWHQGDH